MNSGLTWSVVTTNAAWVQETWTGIATAGYLTVYYKVASSDNDERNGYFDDATPASANGLLRLAVQLKGDALILTWPECPKARLQTVSSLSSTVNWETVTNQISVVGGQRTVTLAHPGNEGLFRLIQP